MMPPRIFRPPNSARLVIALSWTLLVLSAKGGSLATVQPSDPGNWHPLAVGQLVESPDNGTGPSSYWKSFPAEIQPAALDFYFRSSTPGNPHNSYLNFVATTTGPVWMLALARLDAGAIAQLQAAGWGIVLTNVQTELGYQPPGQNVNSQQWILFARSCDAGEQFSIHTDTYQSPVILRTRPPTAPLLRASKYRSGGFIIEASGDPGSYKIQSSSDLINWATESDAILNSPNFQLVSGSSFVVPRKFYRLVSGTP